MVRIVIKHVVSFAVACCKKSTSSCPIMVWIHGGSYQLSDGSPSTYGPNLFMNHNIIMVSVNYRLGPLGFLSMESGELPGNMGLKDQSLALEWIKREATNFCGNPNNITLAGAGAGAESALIQMMSPLNKGRS